MSEDGRCDFNPMHGVVFQPNGGKRVGVHRGDGDFQILGTDVGLVRRELTGGPPECQEGTSSMELDGETAKEGGGVTTSVCNVISGGGLGIITIWVLDLGLVGGNVP